MQLNNADKDRTIFLPLLRYMPLGDARILNTTQVVFVHILGNIFLWEPCGPAEVQLIISILLGIVMVTRPPFLFKTRDQAGGVKFDTTYYVVAGVLVSGALAQAVVMVTCRHQKDIPLIVQLAWTSAVPLIAGTFATYAIGALELPTIETVPFLIVFILFSVSSESTMALALRFELASYATVLKQVLDIVLAFAMEVLWFHQKPGTMAVIGVLLVTSTILLEGLRNRSRLDKS